MDATPEAAARGIHRRLVVDVTDSLRRRLYAGIVRSGDNDCWPWVKSFRNGYGAIKHQGRVHSAHRVAFIIAKGDPGEGMVVMHSCDNTSCCNPAHLIAGTPQENNSEANARGRISRPRGEECPHAKLTEKLVAIIWLHRKTGIGARRISKLTGIRERQIDDVLSGHSWNHLRPSWAKSITK